MFTRGRTIDIHPYLIEYFVSTLNKIIIFEPTEKPYASLKKNLDIYLNLFYTKFNFDTLHLLCSTVQLQYNVCMHFTVYSLILFLPLLMQN